MAISAVPIITDEAETYIDLSTIVDGAGNLLFSVVTSGNANGADIYRYTPAGELVYLDTVMPGPGGVVGHKVDKADITHSGANLVVGLITHDAVSQKPRSIRVEVAQLAGVYAVRAGQEQEAGGAGAHQPEGEPQGGTEVDYDRIQGMINAAMQRIVDNMIPKTKTAIEQTKVVTETMFRNGDEGGSHILYDQLRNTSFSGALDACREGE